MLRTLALIGGWFCLIPRLAAAETWLVQDGKAHAEIVIAEKPIAMVKVAAGELQTYVEKISGAKLPIVSAPSGGDVVPIFVGRSVSTDKLKITAVDANGDALKHGAFRIVGSDKWLVLLGRDSAFTPPEPHLIHNGDYPRLMAEWDRITGEKWGYPHTQVYKQFNRELGIWEFDERGSLNAVHEFLRGLGVRWYLPTELGEIVPRRSSIALPQFDKTVRPDFVLRYPYQYFQRFAGATRDEVLWQLRLGLNLAPDVIGLEGLGHGTTDVHSRPEVKAAHPEYYKLQSGRRDTEKFDGGSPCLSSPGLFEQNVKYVRKVFDQFGVAMVGVMPQDGYTSVCECDLCKAKGTPERGWDGQISDYVWDYVQRVAEEVYKTHPDRKVSCFAYGTYALPPTTIKQLSPNIVVGITQGRANFHNPETRKKIESLRQAWRPLMTGSEPRIVTWEYYIHTMERSPAFGLPVIYPHEIARDVRSLKGISIGEMIEVSRKEPRQDGQSELLTLATNHLNLYVTTRLWWDAEQDIDALLAEFYSLFYGPAAKEMRGYIEFCESHWMNMTKSAADVEQSLTLLAAAQKAAGSGSIYEQRINLITEYTRPMHQLKERLATARQNVPEMRLVDGRSKEITFDGKLDEGFWDGLPTYQLWDLETGKSPATNKTTVKVTSTPNTLYFGIQCTESDMPGLNIAGTKHDDSAIWNGDNIELLFETTAHSYYQIAINPAGHFVDADRKERIETRWNSGAQVVTHKGDGFWSVEVKLPLAGDQQSDIDPLNGIAGRLPNKTFRWPINIGRQRIRGDKIEHSAFALSKTDKTSFHDKLTWGELFVP